MHETACVPNSSQVHGMSGCRLNPSGFGAFSLLLVGCSAVAVAQSRLECAKNQFTASDWTAVTQARYELEQAGPEALPILIRLVRSSQSNALTDTADLIYPGSKEFYGHGGSSIMTLIRSG